MWEEENQRRPAEVGAACPLVPDVTVARGLIDGPALPLVSLLQSHSISLGCDVLVGT